MSAGVAELADASDLGSDVSDVGVQVPSSAPKSTCIASAFLNECIYRQADLKDVGECRKFLVYNIL